LGFHARARPEVLALAARLPVAAFGSLLLAGACFSVVKRGSGGGDLPRRALEYNRAGSLCRWCPSTVERRVASATLPGSRRDPPTPLPSPASAAATGPRHRAAAASVPPSRSCS